jgi:hypothetical protein
MYLSIILTIFVVLQITTLVLIYKWWKKYGKSMFNSFTELKKSFPIGTQGTNPMSNLQDLNNMFKKLEEVNKMIGRK